MWIKLIYKLYVTNISVYVILCCFIKKLGLYSYVAAYILIIFFLLQCIVLACIATSLTKEEDRSKRHLSYWKNLIISHLFESGASTKDLTSMLGPPAILNGNEQNFKLYRIPGFDNILVKAVPKVKTNLTNEDTDTATTPPSDIEKEREPTVAILESYLGTKTLNDTVKALQGVRDMLQSGVLTAQRDAAAEPPKEAVFVIPPTTPGMQFQPVVIKPPQIPVTPFLSHIAPMPIVQNFVLPGLNPLPVQTILPVPIIPSAFKQVQKNGFVTGVSSPDDVTQSNSPLPTPAFLVNRFQHMPFAPLPIRSSLSSIPSYLVPRLMNPVDVVDMPLLPFVNTPPIFVEPSNVAVKSPYPYKPCRKSTVAIAAKPLNSIEEKNSVMRPPLLVKDTVVVPRPPSIIVDRLEKIAGGKIFAQRPIITTSFTLPSRESINEQSKYVNIHPLPATWLSTAAAATNGNISGQQESYKVVNSDGSVTTFSKLSDNFEGPGYHVEMENDEGYYKTDDGRIFYSRLVKDPALEMSKEFQDEARKKHRKTQYTVTNVEEFKNLLNRDDVQVTYGFDKDNEPFLSYWVPSGGYSFQQVKNFSKLKEDNFPPLNFSDIKESTNKSQTSDKGTELPSGTSKYSFKQIHGDGSITEYIAYDSKNSEVAVLNNVQDFGDSKENSKGTGQTPIPGLTLKESTQIFQQIGHNNPQSAAGQVEDTPTRFGDKGQDQDKFNAHVSSDRRQNWGTEVHSVPASVVAKMPSPLGLSSTLPKEFHYIPPTADVPFISTHKDENKNVNGNYSFKMIDHRATLKPVEPPKTSRNANIPTFSNTNPIVVSGLNEEEGGSSSRGDIPDAYS